MDLLDLLKLASGAGVPGVLGSRKPNLVSNGNFAVWTDDDPDDWSVAEVGDATSNVTESAGGGECHIISDGTIAQISQPILTIGESYSVQLTITDASSGSIDVLVGSSGTSQSYNSAGVKEFIGTCGGNTNFVIRRTSGGCDITVDNVEVRAQ